MLKMPKSCLTHICPIRKQMLQHGSFHLLINLQIYFHEKEMWWCKWSLLSYQEDAGDASSWFVMPAHYTKSK